MCKMQCVNGSASRTSWTYQLDGPAGRNSWTDQLDGPAGRTSWTDQLDRPVFLFEALASSHIRRFSFQFVHCRSFRVRRRPCFLLKKFTTNLKFRLRWKFIFKPNFCVILPISIIYEDMLVAKKIRKLFENHRTLSPPPSLPPTLGSEA